MSRKMLLYGLSTGHVVDFFGADLDEVKWKTRNPWAFYEGFT